MVLEVDATYADGMLTLDQALPLREQSRVRVSIDVPNETAKTLQGRVSYGLIGWTGDPQILRQIAESDEAGLQESP